MHLATDLLPLSQYTCRKPSSLVKHTCLLSPVPHQQDPLPQYNTPMNKPVPPHNLISKCPSILPHLTHAPTSQGRQNSQCLHIHSPSLKPMQQVPRPNQLFPTCFPRISQLVEQLLSTACMVWICMESAESSVKQPYLPHLTRPMNMNNGEWLCTYPLAYGKA